MKLKNESSVSCKLNEVPSVVSEKKQALLKYNSFHQSSRLGRGAYLTPLAVEEAETSLDKLLISYRYRDDLSP